MASEIVLKESVFQAFKDICVDAYAGEPIELSGLLMAMMDVEGVPMHYPYHHFIVPAALLTAASQAAGNSAEALSAMLDIAEERSKNILAGFCGLYGTCGAGAGTGIFMSVFTESTPYSEETWQWANEITGLSLQAISEVPGPRCCKRTAYLAVQTAVPYIKKRLDLELVLAPDILCKYYEQNPDCKHTLCPFFPKAGV